MFRRVAVKLSAPTVTAKVPTAPTLEVFRSVNRMLGGRHEPWGSITIYDTVLASKPDSATVTAAAHLGRAHGLLQRHATGAALEEVEAFLAAPSGPETLRRLATALRLKINTVRLDDAEHRMLVSGAGNETEVSTLRGAVDGDLAKLAKANPDCWLTALATAEFTMCKGDYPTAAAQLTTIIDKINARIIDTRTNVIHDEAPVAVDERNAAVVASYQMATCAGATSSVVDILKKDLGLNGSVEALAIAEVLGAAATDHIFVDFFSTTDRYAMWPSTAAKAVVDSLLHYGGCADSIDTTVAGYQPSKPADAYHGDAAELAKLLSGPATTSVIDALAANYGAKSSPITEADRTFRTVMDELEDIRKKYPTKGARCVDFQVAAANTLREQLLFRSMVDKALVLEQLGKGEEGLKLLHSVVVADKYIHMWKALLASGRINTNLGNVDAAEADYRRLFALKKTHEGVDVPQVDANRNKSYF